MSLSSKYNFRTHDVFISWNHRDKEKLELVQKYLKEYGKDISFWSSDSGDNYGVLKDIFPQIDNCSTLLLVLSPNTLNSFWCACEFVYASKKLGINQVLGICFDDVENIKDKGKFDPNIYPKNSLMRKYLQMLWSDNATKYDNEKFKLDPMVLIDTIENMLLDRVLQDILGRDEPFTVKRLFEGRNKLFLEGDISDLYISRHLRINDEEYSENQFISSLLNENSHYVITAKAGIGKTEFSKKLASKINGEEKCVSFYIKCRQFASSKLSLVEYLYSVISDKVNARFTLNNIQGLLNSKKVVLIFDGYDEILNGEHRDSFDFLVNEIKNTFPNIRIVITSRFMPYFYNELEDFHQAELSGFNSKDVNDFAKNLFFKIRTVNEKGEAYSEEEFFAKLNDLDNEIKSNPLFLSQLIFIYKLEGKVLNSKIAILEKTSSYIAKIDTQIGLSAPVSEVVFSYLFPYLVFLKKYRHVDDPLSEFLKEEMNLSGIALEETKISISNYLEERAIVIEDEFVYEIFNGYYAATYIYNKSFSGGVFKDNGEDEFLKNLEYVKDQYSIIEMLVSKLDYCLPSESLEKVISLLTPFINQQDAIFGIAPLCKNYELINKCAIKAILQGSITDRFSPYGELFYYADKYVSDLTLLLAGSELLNDDLLADNKIISLVRDYLFLIKGKRNIEEIDIPKEVVELYQKTTQNIELGYRNALNCLFFNVEKDVTSLLNEENKRVHPFFLNLNNVIKAKKDKFSLLGECELDVPFADELGLYNHNNNSDVGVLTVDYQEYDKYPKSNRIIALIFNNSQCEMLSELSLFKNSIKVVVLPSSIKLIKFAKRIFGQFKPLYFKDNCDYSSLYWEYGVIVINGCSTNLNNVYLPLSVVSIDEEGFNNCSFHVLELPPRVVRIDSNAFRNTILYYLYIPASVTYLDEEMFDRSIITYRNDSDCDAINRDFGPDCRFFDPVMLKEGEFWQDYVVVTDEFILVKKDDELTIVHGLRGGKIITVPEGVTAIGQFAFLGLTIGKLILPSTINTLYPFSLDGVMSVYITSPIKTIYGNVSSPSFDVDITPETVGLVNIELDYEEVEDMDEGEQVIDDFFVVSGEKDNYTLVDYQGNEQEVHIPDGVTYICKDAFKNKPINHLFIPRSVKEIHDHAFAGSHFLKKVVIEGEISIISESLFYECTNLSTVVLPPSVKKIDDFAFYRCIMLEKINIPDSVTYIGLEAFHNCSLLHDFNIPSNLEIVREDAFSGCKFIPESISFPASIKLIEKKAFKGCENLKEAKFVDGEEELEIQDFAFSNTYLKEIKLPRNIKSLSGMSFPKETKIIVPSDSKYLRLEDDMLYSLSDHCLISYFGQKEIIAIPEGVKVIGPNAFSKNEYIKEIHFPNSLKEVGDFAFSEVKNLKKITFPKNITKLGKNVLDCCSSLEEIVIEGDIKEIPFRFAGFCMNLISVKLNGKVEKIDISAFIHCKKLKDISLPDTIKVIEQDAFYGNEALEKIKIPQLVKRIHPETFKECVSLKEVDFGNVQIIYREAFSGCSSLQSVTLPDALVSLDTEVFLDCVSLQNVTIPKSLKEIGINCFSKCSKLNHISPLVGVENIGYNAFGYSGLEEIDLYALKEIGEMAFNCCYNLKRINFHTKVDNLSLPFYAFSNTLIEEIILPDGVTSINTGAFQNCHKLKKVTFTETINDIEPGAFDDCPSLERHIYNRGVYLGDETNPYFVLIGLDNVNQKMLTDFKIHPECRIISSIFLFGNPDFDFIVVPTLVIPSSVKSIATESMTYIKPIEIVFEGKLQHLGTNIFSPHQMPQIIKYHEDDKLLAKSAIYRSAKYHNEDISLLYEDESVSYIYKGKKVLVYISSNDIIFVPNDIDIISTGAVNSHQGTIIIPTSVTKIENHALNGLKEIYYEGSKEQFEKIEVGSQEHDYYIAIIYFRNKKTRE